MRPQPDGRGVGRRRRVEIPIFCHNNDAHGHPSKGPCAEVRFLDIYRHVHTFAGEDVRLERGVAFPDKTHVPP